MNAPGRTRVSLSSIGDHVNRLTLNDPAALKAVADALKAGGLYVPSDDWPTLFAPIAVTVAVDGQEFLVAGRTVNHAPAGYYVQLDAGPTVDGLTAAVAKAAVAAPAPVPPSPAPGAEATSEGLAPPLGGGRNSLVDPSSDVPLHKQIADLTVQEKIKLARTATRPMRRILIRAVDKRIHVAVVKNPSVGDDEIQEYTSIGGLSPAALTWIATQRQYLRNRRTLMNIVMNPQTPQTTSLKLLGMLQNNELLRVSRSARVRQALQQAAKRKLMMSGVI